MVKTSWALTGSAILLVASLATAYQNGAARSSCQSLSPAAGHTGTEITSLIPYNIQIEHDQYSYSPGELITVTITSAGTAFTGLLLQARPVIDYRYNKPITKRATGHFAFPHKWTNLRTMDCWSKADSITQATPYRDIDRITLHWIAPAGDVGEIVFVATVMKDQHTWYTGVMSYVLRYKAKLTLPPPATSSLQPVTSTSQPAGVIMSSGYSVNVMTIRLHVMAAVLASLTVWI